MNLLAWMKKVNGGTPTKLPIAPTWLVSGVPLCSEDCPHHDGKRCAVIGHRPGNICEPAALRMASLLNEAEDDGS